MAETGYNFPRLSNNIPLSFYSPYKENNTHRVQVSLLKYNNNYDNYSNTKFGYVENMGHEGGRAF